jgi:diguanylate cyclase (GGDEF)-like protein
MLSIATAPVDARQRFVAIAVIVALTGTTFALQPAAATALPPALGAIPFLLGIAVASQLVTAYLLFGQFLATRLVGTAFLGAAYVAGALWVLAYVVTFPGVFGSSFAPQVAPWTWIAWNVEFPLVVIVALWFDRSKRFVDAPGAAARLTWTMLAGATAIVVIPAVALAVRGAELPMVIHGVAFSRFANGGIAELLVVVNLLALVLAVVWTRGRTVLHTWLIVALVAACLEVQISVSGGGRFTLGWYFGRLLVVCSSTAVLYAYLRQIDVLFAKLSDLSMVDGLTELPNRRSFETRLNDAIRAAHRAGRPLAVLMTDVDAFKQYNDTYGHLAGDEALKTVASTLRVAAMRPGDVVARWGGEEFVAFLAETDSEGAYLVADRLRGAIAALAIPHSNTVVPARVVTISVGVATLGGRDDTSEALIARADAALYRAKNSGRNTVAVELTPAEALLLGGDLRGELV